MVVSGRQCYPCCLQLPRPSDGKSFCKPAALKDIEAIRGLTNQFKELQPVEMKRHEMCKVRKTLEYVSSASKTKKRRKNNYQAGKRNYNREQCASRGEPVKISNNDKVIERKLCSMIIDRLSKTSSKSKGKDKIVEIDAPANVQVTKKNTNRAGRVL